jgi:hypothetical protein
VHRLRVRLPHRQAAFHRHRHRAGRRLIGARPSPERRAACCSNHSRSRVKRAAVRTGLPTGPLTDAIHNRSIPGRS